MSDTNPFVQIFESLADSIDQENLELYKKIIGDNPIPIRDNEDFYFKMIYPYENFLEGFIQSRYSNNHDLKFLLINQRFIQANYEKLIQKFEGSACCADKSRTIITYLVQYFIDPEKNPIVFNWNQEYTFHYCKVTFTNQEQILDFFKSLKTLYYGNPDPYFEEYRKVLERGVQALTDQEKNA